MRICFVSAELAPINPDGIGTYVYLACRAFRDEGHEVHVLTVDSPDLQAHARGLFPGIRVHAARPGQGAAALEIHPNPHVLHAMAVHSTLNLLHDAHPFDYVEFSDYLAEGYFTARSKICLGRFHGTVLGVRLHTSQRDVRAINREAWFDQDAAILDRMEDSLLQECDLLLSPSRALLRQVRDRIPGARHEAVVPYPVDPTWLARGLREPRAAPRPQVLFCGRLEERKGVRLLVAAAVDLLERGCDADFCLIGRDTSTGPAGRSMREVLEQMMPPLFRERFQFLPQCPLDRLLELMQQATVCCFPSLWENLAYTCLEAMAAGAVVVASDAGGMGEVIEDGESGFLFHGGDARALGQCLERALHSVDGRRRISNSARARVAALCDPKRVVAETIDAIGRVLPRPRTARMTRARSAATPAVSIVVPHYNLGGYLPATLESIRRQTFDSYEVLVVDDGSTDPASLTALDRCDGGRVRVIRKKHGGLGSARNAGLEAARGQWMLPLDADDLLAPSFVEKAVAVFDRAPELGLVTSLVSFFIDNPETPTGGMIPFGLDRELLCFANVASTSTALLWTERLRALGGYDEHLTSFEDWDLYLSMAERQERAEIIPEFLFHYRVRADSMSRTEARLRRYRLMAQLLARHPLGPIDHGRALRIYLAELARLDNAPAGIQQPAPLPIPPSAPPLRHRVADRLNAALKALPFVHPAMKQIANRTSAGAKRSGAALRAARDRAVSVSTQLIGTVTHVATSERLLALTFDDGPHPAWTPKLLDILEEHGAFATFFVLGERACRYPEILKRMRRDGHSIGNHSWDHPSFPSLCRAERQRQLTACEDIIGPRSERLFRPPFMNLDLESMLDLQIRGYRIIGFNSSGDDWQGDGAEVIAARVATRLAPGNIVLLHDALHLLEDDRFASREATLQAVRSLLDGPASSYRCVTISELLRRGRAEKEWHRQPGDSAYLAKLHSSCATELEGGGADDDDPGSPGNDMGTSA